MLISAFYLLLLMQIYNSKTQKLDNNSFMIGLLSGGIAFILYLFDLINKLSTNNELLTIHLESLMFISFSLCFYFWYRHYFSIVSLFYDKEESKSLLLNFKLTNKIFKPLSALDIFLISGILISVFSYILLFLNILTLFDFFWEILGIPGGGGLGRAVTITSHITFLSGAVVFLYITIIIISNNLLDFGKLKVYELMPILLLSFINIFLFINDLFITFDFYTGSGEISEIFIIIGLILFFISMLVLIIDYIIVNPFHLQSPSIYKQIKLNLDLLNEEDGLLVSITDFEDSYNIQDLNKKLDYIQKMNGTSILILLYILRNDNVIAKDIEDEFNIKKSTLSYNIRILETEKFIERTSRMEKRLQEGGDIDTDDDLDQRQKIIFINEKGRKFLESLHYSLKGIF